MSNNKNIKTIAVFFDGTLCADKKKPGTLIGWFAAVLLPDSTNSMLQLYENCEEECKYYFPGPGSDIYDKDGTVFGTISGLIDGHLGKKGITNTLDEVKKMLIKEWEAAKKLGQQIELQLFSYSRGGFAVLELIKDLPPLLATYAIQIPAIYLYNLDPVVGNWFDRRHLWLMSEKKNPENIPIYSYTFYGTGKLVDLSWPLNGNTPFFSGLDMDEGAHYSQKILFNANHLEIPGQLLVLYFLLNACEGVKFNEAWKAAIIKKGKEFLETTEEQHLTPKNNRKYLLPNTLKGCFVGEHKPNLATPATYKKMNFR